MKYFMMFYFSSTVLNNFVNLTNCIYGFVALLCLVVVYGFSFRFGTAPLSIVCFQFIVRGRKEVVKEGERTCCLKSLLYFRIFRRIFFDYVRISKVTNMKHWFRSFLETSCFTNGQRNSPCKIDQKNN